MQLLLVEGMLLSCCWLHLHQQVVLGEEASIVAGEFPGSEDFAAASAEAPSVHWVLAATAGGFLEALGLAGLAVVVRRPSSVAGSSVH